MVTTIAYGTTSIQPRLVVGWQQARDSRNVEHPIIGGGLEITRTPPSTRVGTLTLLFTSEPDAIAAEQLHRDAPYVDLASDERALVNMRYVIAEGGQIQVNLDEETRNVWQLLVEYREILP